MEVQLSPVAVWKYRPASAVLVLKVPASGVLVLEVPPSVVPALTVLSSAVPALAVPILWIQLRSPFAVPSAKRLPLFFGNRNNRVGAK
ncbi:MAG: hypothetical protein LBK82_09725 [Planctomycetaceae bacterium]|nr:hypothetical protein [Planctomycetaceae bacterium]